IISTINLQGGMNGIQFLQEIKENNIFKKIPFIMISDKVNMEDTIKNLGVNLFVPKPYIIKDLLENIKDIFTQYKLTNQKTFSLQELTENLKQIRAKNIMTKEVITVKKEDTLDDIAELMIEKRISGFPVMENNKIIGIITTNDLFLVMDMIKTGEILRENSPDNTLPKVRYVMSTEVVTADPDSNLDEIIALMKYRNIHTLPIVENNQLVGVIGRRDVFKNFYCTVKGICLPD
ncbi:MAG: CBS domain-containing protein, partial [Atribacterota bacterium]|nr:CBS domain-containing protein [Atribacterota bacterium]